MELALSGVISRQQMNYTVVKSCGVKVILLWNESKGIRGMHVSDQKDVTEPWDL